MPAFAGMTNYDTVSEGRGSFRMDVSYCRVSAITGINISYTDPQCLCTMVTTVTWLGGQGDERRQPRLGGGHQEDLSFLPPEEAGCIFPPHLRRSQRLRMPSSAPWPPTPLSSYEFSHQVPGRNTSGVCRFNIPGFSGAEGPCHRHRLPGP